WWAACSARSSSRSRSCPSSTPGGGRRSFGGNKEPPPRRMGLRHRKRQRDRIGATEPLGHGRPVAPWRAPRPACPDGRCVDTLVGPVARDSMETVPGKGIVFGQAPVAARRTTTGRITGALLDRLAARVTTRGGRDAFEVRI